MASLGGWERALKRAVRPLVPSAARRAYLNWRARHPRYNRGSPEDVFSAIYRDGMWGSAGDFYSGAGSHDPAITGPYVEALRSFLLSLPRPPDVVDLGCGDFAIGAQVRASCAGYVACDVVPALIERNRRRFADLAVDFRALDLVTADLPPGEVAFVRQVLQHLSNDQIEAVLPKLAGYRYLIVTEHLPRSAFVPNLDKAAGVSTRLAVGSGVELESAPFHLQARERRVLTEVEDRGSIIRTMLWIDPHL